MIAWLCPFRFTFLLLAFFIFWSRLIAPILPLLVLLKSASTSVNALLSVCLSVCPCPFQLFRVVLFHMIDYLYLYGFTFVRLALCVPGSAWIPLSLILSWCLSWSRSLWMHVCTSLCLTLHISMSIGLFVSGRRSLNN